jgi:hypothetical protein
MPSTTDNGLSLNDLDNEIIDFAQANGDRITPKWASAELDRNRSYVTQRMTRLSEHGIFAKPYRGLYDLIEDPR